MDLVRAPMAATVVAILVETGSSVRNGTPLVIVESMKMEHIVEAPTDGVVGEVFVAPNDVVQADDPLLYFTHGVVATAGVADDEVALVDLDVLRPDLTESIERHELGFDAFRADAVARRHASGLRTARENLNDLLDPGSFVEYAPLVVAAQRRRRSAEELQTRTPGDGLIGGVGTIDGQAVVAVSYDYMVLAGTQGLWNHLKKDRLFELAERLRAPVVLFAEGGGGRPGDTDGLGVTGLDCLAFNYFAQLSGLVPLIGIAAGYCFAGNAALLGCCDVVIATRGSNIGMGGPAMIEGGGLGTYDPKAIGPSDLQHANGVIDVLVDDEAEAVTVAKRYISFFRGSQTVLEGDAVCGDQRALRHVIPENRVRVYDVRNVINTMVDTDSALELREGFAPGMVTALGRIDGRPIGVLANNPMHLGGAIDSNCADKAARFMQLCDAYDLPIVSLCDTPGFMVGPESEATAAVRHVSRMFVTGANLSVPMVTIVLRKGYGLGAQSMAGGSFKAPLFCVAWPTGEFGGMNIEGAVRLGMRRELEAIDDDTERDAAFEAMVERMYSVGRAVNVANHFEIDDVIDPADSRRWITAVLSAVPAPAPRHAKKRAFVDTW